MKFNGLTHHTVFNDVHFLAVGTFFLLFITCFLFALESLCLWPSDNPLESFDFLNMFFKTMVSKVSKKIKENTNYVT